MKGRGPWRWRRWSGRGRRPKPRLIWGVHEELYFIPSTVVPPALIEGLIEIAPDELEALRLVYLEGMSQEEAAKLMGVSRGTVWRLLESGRKKLVMAIVEGRAIRVVGGSHE